MATSSTQQSTVYLVENKEDHIVIYVTTSFKECQLYINRKTLRPWAFSMREYKLDTDYSIDHRPRHVEP